MNGITIEEHIKRHKELHRALDELVADMITCTEKSLSTTSVMDLIRWSHEQTIHPQEKGS